MDMSAVLGKCKWLVEAGKHRIWFLDIKTEQGGCESGGRWALGKIMQPLRVAGECDSSDISVINSILVGKIWVLNCSF